MIILTYLNNLVSSLQDSNIPDEGKLALALFIFAIILLLCKYNNLFYNFNRIR